MEAGCKAESRKGKHGNSRRGRFRGRHRGCHSTERNQVSSADVSKQRELKPFTPSEMGPRLSEHDAGITEYTSDNKGFIGIIKDRFSDFQVNEIAVDGEIVKLTCLNVPKDNIDSPPQEAALTCDELIPGDVWKKLIRYTLSRSEVSKETKKKDGIQVSKSSSTEENFDEAPSHHNRDCKSEAILELKQNISEEARADTCSHLDGATSKTPLLEVKSEEFASEEPVELEVTCMDKSARQKIHLCVKHAFKDLVSNTVERNGKKYIVFSFSKGKQADRRNGRPGGRYLYFVVHKRNKDTTETVNLISQKLRLSPNMITYAGTKDRRGITSQLMCLRGGEPKRLFSVSKGLRDVWLGNFTFHEKALRLGDLMGNQFRIAIRGVQGSDDQISQAMSSFEELGYINYFGLQRFGANADVPTHEIGKVILKGLWEKAVEMILHPKRNENISRYHDDVRAACEEWQARRDPKVALEKLRSGSRSVEGTLLWGLSKCQANDFVGALSALPRNMRSLYLHAYQSLIWNKIVSRRIKEHGLQPLVGDLVPINAEGKEVIDREGFSLSVNSQQENDEEERSCGPHVMRCITAEELETVKIKDIVLPMPGYDTIYPQNFIKDWYTDLLKEDGLTPDAFQPKVQQYSLKGAYRHIVAQPENLSWKLVHYADPLVDLLTSDFDELMGKKASEDLPGADKKALLITMCLKTCSYATMALREIMKTDTSPAIHAKFSSNNAKDAAVSVSESTSNSNADLKRTADEPSNENSLGEKRFKLTDFES